MLWNNNLKSYYRFMEWDIDDRDWMKDGNCIDKDTKIFFPNKGRGLEIAKIICEDCVVTQECLEYAISNNIDFGVWGGKSEKERRAIIRRSSLNY